MRTLFVYTCSYMLIPYKRHTRECLNGPEGKPELGLLSRKLSAEALRAWKHCKCPCWYSGSWNGQYHPRKSASTNSWAAAERLCADLMRDPRAPGQAVENSAGEKSASDLSLHEALDRWHLASTLAPLSASTMGAHRLLGTRLEEFCKAHHITQLADVTTDLINLHRMDWVQKEKVKETTHHTRFVILQSLFNYAVKRKWLAENPMTDMIAPKQNPPSKEATMPLDPDGGDANYRRVLSAFLRTKTTDPRIHPLRRNPLRLVALAKLLYESGMRISDALAFSPSKVIEKDGCAVYEFLPKKTRKYPRTCTTFFTLETLAEIRALTPISLDRPFWDGKDATFACYATTAWRSFIWAGEQAHVSNCHPHRFRDSFAINALNNGATLDDVSKWLGHSSVKTTEQNYAPWVKSRQDASRRSWLRTQQTEAPANVVPIQRRQKA